LYRWDLFAVAFGGLLAVVVVLAVAVPLVAGFEEGKTFSDIFCSFLAKCLQKTVAFVCVCVWV
jgi:hypothetical protein